MTVVSEVEIGKIKGGRAIKITPISDRKAAIPSTSCHFSSSIKWAAIPVNIGAVNDSAVASP